MVRQDELAGDVLMAHLALVPHVRQPLTVPAERRVGHLGGQVLPLGAEDAHHTFPLVEVVHLLHRDEGDELEIIEPYDLSS